jgi:ATP diphosphatase
MERTSGVERLLGIMARLRDPEGGCPWDVEQDFRSIAPYTIEEAYEVEHAIERGDMEGLREELGDLLLQVVFHARMAEEAGHFAFGDVVEAICEKLVRRHPHVFGDVEVGSAAAQLEAWESYKAAERAEKGEGDPFADVPRALPALTRAAKLQRRAEHRGLAQRPEAKEAAARVAARLERLERIEGQGPADAPDDAARQLGALLFECVHLARHLDVDAEQALRDATSEHVARARRAGRSEGGEP